MNCPANDDWILPPSTVKRQCDSCPREFASRNGALTCAYCLDMWAQRLKRAKQKREAELVQDRA